MNDYLDYLEHYGVKGMKWGHHIFGKESRAARRERINQSFEPTIKTKNGKVSPAERGLRSAKTMTDESQSAVRNIAEIRRKKVSNEDLTAMRSMDDQTLRNTINRMNLEKQYVNLITPDISPGYEKAERIIGVVGNVFAAGASAAAIATAYKTMKHAENMPANYLQHYGVKGMKCSMIRYFD